MRNRLQYSFVEGVFSSLIAYNRGYPLKNSDESLEDSYIGMSRLLYYSQLDNSYARMDHELKYSEYYLQLLQLRYPVQYRILKDGQTRKWAVERLRIHNVIEQTLNDTEISEPVEIIVDAENLSGSRKLVITIVSGTFTKSELINVRRMKENHSSFYML
ncbi:MAG: hypothetical protein PQJ50_09360 [Spirochaetales bacterium]|nr:hypothetical protein [Spirochaetales bacterium]